MDAITAFMKEVMPTLEQTIQEDLEKKVEFTGIPEKFQTHSDMKIMTVSNNPFA